MKTTDVGIYLTNLMYAYIKYVVFIEDIPILFVVSTVIT
jgi:hypothetical protein